MRVISTAQCHARVTRCVTARWTRSPSTIAFYTSSLETTDPNLFIYYPLERTRTTPPLFTNQGEASPAYDLFMDSSHLGSNLACPVMVTYDPTVVDEIYCLNKGQQVVYCDSDNASTFVKSGLTLQNASEQHTVAYAVLGCPLISHARRRHFHPNIAHPWHLNTARHCHHNPHHHPPLVFHHPSHLRYPTPNRIRVLRSRRRQQSDQHPVHLRPRRAPP